MECNNCINYKPENSALIIPSKYKIGDTVWVMHYNKPTTKVIQRILIDITESECNIKYTLSGGYGTYPESWIIQHAFRTKQELIKSL